MAEMLSALGMNPFTFVWIGVLVCGSFIAMYRKYALSVFDPISVFILSSIVSTTIMLVLPGWPNSVKVEYIAFVVFFWLGFKKCSSVVHQHPTVALSLEKVVELEVVIHLLFVIVVVANLYLGISTGFPLLTADPTVAKVSYFTGGLGIVKRIDGAPFVVLSSGCILLSIIGYKRALFLSYLLLASFLVALGGSKSALLPILFIFVFVVAHSGLRNAPKTARVSNRYTFLILFCAVLIATAVEFQRGGGLQAAFSQLAERIVYSGDIVFYYYPRRGMIEEIAHLNVVDYLKYLLGPTMGFLRIIEYPPALGSVIIGHADSGFGPNVQYFARADIFFGPIVGCVYCFLNGYLIAKVRRVFFEYSGKDLVGLTLRLMLATTALSIAVESQLFVSAVVDTILMVAPVWGIAIVVRTAVVVPRLSCTGYRHETCRDGL